ncbi:astakine [Anabrus simplex]|uniref:astakine n=1 Tax=Anabrus simplex TaxID=316456 RepID=UPI0035A30559
MVHGTTSLAELVSCVTECLRVKYSFIRFRGRFSLARDMLRPFVVAVVLAVLLVEVMARYRHLTLNIGCVNSDDCEPGHCCVVGHTRYSYPMCQPLLKEGRSCRPRGHDPTNTTLYYPNDETVDLINIYYTFCRCEEDLTCSEETATCVA